MGPILGGRKGREGEMAIKLHDPVSSFVVATSKSHFYARLPEVHLWKQF